jgi:hypothetical protein
MKTLVLTFVIQGDATITLLEASIWRTSHSLGVVNGGGFSYCYEPLITPMGLFSLYFLFSFFRYVHP